MTKAADFIDDVTGKKKIANKSKCFSSFKVVSRAVWPISLLSCMQMRPQNTKITILGTCFFGLQKPAAPTAYETTGSSSTGALFRVSSAQKTEEGPISFS